MNPVEDSEKGRGPVSEPERDWLLQQFVEEANARKGDFMAVTILARGQIISGMLVGVNEYLKYLENVFSRDGVDTGEGTWAAYFRDVRQNTEKEIDEQGATSPAFIHLRDARIHQHGQRPLPSNEGVWWRGRISQIEAFWPGRLVVGGDDKD